MPEIRVIEEEVLAGIPPLQDEPGFGAVRTEAGLLPLAAMDLAAELTGLDARVVVTQTFVNHHARFLEATYVFPLPDRSGVTRLTMRVGKRRIEGVLQDRGQARRDYQVAIESGHRAAIAEEERPGVFTMRAGNIPPGETLQVELEMVGPLPVVDGEVTFQFPLVVAPRYIPGDPLPGELVGSGTAWDTDSVPDASRITPPVLLPGHPRPVRLGIEVLVDSGGLELGALESSLHQLVVEEVGPKRRRVTLARDTERLDRDFLLRYRLGGEELVSSLRLAPDEAEDGCAVEEGTLALTVVPPAPLATGVPPRDVVVVLDRSGSMGGWKMPTARRAAGRLLDTLTDRDRFGVVLFDNRVESFALPGGQPALVPASDRNRYRGVEFLTAATARGGTEMGVALDEALRLLGEPEEGREPVVVFFTDGQVGNEDQLLWKVRHQAGDTRLFTVGIDQAVNGSFLRRLAAPTGGSCELVESEDRLDQAMESIFRRIGRPVLTDVRLQGELFTEDASWTPDRGRDVFPGVPLVLRGRYRGTVPEQLSLVGTRSDGSPFTQEVSVERETGRTLATAWARSRVLDLEHAYVTAGERDRAQAAAITRLSLEFGVLSRFTAFVAVDREEVVNEGGHVESVTQPVEAPSGWDMFADAEGAPEMEKCKPLAPPPAPFPVAASSAPTGPMSSGFPATLAGGGGPLPRKPMARLAKQEAAPSSPLEKIMDGLGGLFGGGQASPTPSREEEFCDLGGTFELLDEAPPPPLLPFRADLDSLWKQSLRPLRKLQDARELARWLRFLLTDLDEVIAKLAGDRSTPAELLSELRELLALLEGLEENQRQPGAPRLGELLERLDRVLAEALGETSAPGRAPRPPPREDFWL